MLPLLHSVPGAAKRLDVSESTIWRLVAERKLHPTHVRSRTMISEVELQRYVAASTVRPREKAAPISDNTLKETAETRARETTQDDVADE
jgi:excisionase family DNA binding protein